MHPSRSPHAASEAKSDAEHLRRLRHSLAHVLAQAVQSFRPGAKLGFGPAIDDGFYYDFLLPQPLTEGDLPELERRMRELLRQGQRFECEVLPGPEALARMEEQGEPYQRSYAEELLAQRGRSSLSFYRSGSFVDLCEGPHVSSTQDIPEDCFRLRSVAGAYWRGRADQPMMTRIYAWAFASGEELLRHVRAFEAAAERDHKKLGQKLELFAFDDEVGRGLPLWLPNGTVVRDELERWMKELEFQDGFLRVATPHLAREALYLRTGHLPYYADGMFPPMRLGDPVPGEDERGSAFRLRPMNCPHHHKVFAARKRSYRELPFRLAEYGQVYRYEDSGSVSGLLRVRGMCMNDGHIYCAREQVLSECAAVLRMHRHVYSVLGLEGWRVRLSLRDDGPLAKQKFLEDSSGWEDAEALLRQALVDSGLPFFEGRGEAAFYGPKIDFQFRMVTGREETASTLQLDFGMAARLGLSYVGADGQPHPPYILHRAPLGTHERFVALLVEQCGGAFPTWLAPVQVRVLPVGEPLAAYGREVVQRLRAHQVRAELDDSGESLSRRIRLAAGWKVPNVLVLGEREQARRTVTLRCHGHSQQVELGLDAFESGLLEAIRERAREGGPARWQARSMGS